MMPAAYIDEKKLIESVRKRTHLYDPDHPRHNQRLSTVQTWTEIASELGHEPLLVKERWSSLRDYYRRKLREVEKIKAGKLKKRLKLWPLFNKLTFLNPYLRELSDLRPPVPAYVSRNDSDDNSEEEGITVECIKVDYDSNDDNEDSHSGSQCFNNSAAQVYDDASLNCMVEMQPSSSKKSLPNTRRLKRRKISSNPRLDTPDEGNATSSCTKQKRSETPSGAKHLICCKEQPASEINTNVHFFKSLVPLVETLEPIKAMKFRHDVHDLLMRYCCEKWSTEQEKTSQNCQTVNSDSNRDDFSNV